MPYQPSHWGPTAEDRRGEFALAGGKALAEGIGKAGDLIAAGITESITSREKSRALDASMDLIQAQVPDLVPPDFVEKFHAGSVTQKAGMLPTMMAMLQRRDDASKESESARRFGLDYGLRSANAANTAAYQQAQVDNMAADNTRQNKKLDYELAPDNQQPVTVDMPGATAYGVTGDKTGTRIFNFIPKPKAPVQPGMVIDPKTGTGYFSDGAGKPVNPEYLLQSPPAPPPPSGPSTDLLPLPDMTAAPPGQLAPAAPAEPAPPPPQELPAGRPFTTRPELLVPRRTPPAPTGWKLKPSSGGVFAEKGDQVARWDEESKQWIATDMPASAVPAPVPATTTTPATTPAPKRWR